MKEIHTSLRFTSEASNTIPLVYLGKRRFPILALIVVTFIATSHLLSAQSTDPAIATLSLTPELVMSEWKSPAEYASVISSMKANTFQKLAEPNLQEQERALYTGFERLLIYIQADLDANVEVNKIAEINYNKVVAEAPSDPLLFSMKMDEFKALYEMLVNKLRP